MDPPKKAAPYLETEVTMHNLMMVESYKRKVGRYVVRDSFCLGMSSLAL